MSVPTWSDILTAAGQAYSPIVATAACAVSAFTYFRDNRKLNISFVLTFYVNQIAIDGQEEGLVVTHGDPLVEAVIDSSVPHIVQRIPKGLHDTANGTIKLRIACTNSGRRPISIRRWSLLYGDRTTKKQWRLDNGEITDLDPNPIIAESTTYTIEVNDLLTIGLHKFEYEGAYIVVEDNHGKQWKLPESDFLSLRKGINMFQFSKKMDLALDTDDLPERIEDSPDYQAGFEAGTAEEKLPPLATRMWQRGFHDAFRKKGIKSIRRN